MLTHSDSLCHPTLQATMSKVSLLISRNGQCNNIGATFNPFNMTSMVRPSCSAFSFYKLVVLKYIRSIKVAKLTAQIKSFLLLFLLLLSFSLDLQQLMLVFTVFNLYRLLFW